MRMQPDVHALGQFVRARRRALGLSQEQLASRADESHVRISYLEHGHSGLPTLTRLARLADALEVPLAQLISVAGFRLDG